MSLAQFPQLQSLPEGALACFVAAQCVPVGMTKGGLATWTERFRRLLSVYRQCRHAFHLLSASITPVGPQADASPSVLMALSSERWPTFREMFPGIQAHAVSSVSLPSLVASPPIRHPSRELLRRSRWPRARSEGMVRTRSGRSQGMAATRYLPVPALPVASEGHGCSPLTPCHPLLPALPPAIPPVSS